MKSMVKEQMEPMSGPDMKRYDEFLAEHETDTHKHKKHDMKQHAGGHMDHMENVMKMCGGGMYKSK